MHHGSSWVLVPTILEFYLRLAPLIKTDFAKEMALHLGAGAMLNMRYLSST